MTMTISFQLTWPADRKWPPRCAESCVWSSPLKVANRTWNEHTWLCRAVMNSAAGQETGGTPFNCFIVSLRFVFVLFFRTKGRMNLYQKVKNVWNVFTTIPNVVIGTNTNHWCKKKKLEHFVFIFKLTISCSSLQRTAGMLHSFEIRFDCHCRLPQNTSWDVSLIGRTKPVIKIPNRARSAVFRDEGAFALACTWVFLLQRPSHSRECGWPDRFDRSSGWLRPKMKVSRCKAASLAVISGKLQCQSGYVTSQNTSELRSRICSSKVRLCLLVCKDLWFSGKTFLESGPHNFNGTVSFSLESTSNQRLIRTGIRASQDCSRPLM